MGAVVSKTGSKRSQRDCDKLPTFDDVSKEARISPYPTPPTDGSCPLLELFSTEVLELILDKLYLRDVVALMLTSKTAKGMADQYIGRKSKQYRWFVAYTAFLRNNPMTKPEMDAYVKYSLRQERQAREARCTGCMLQNVVSTLKGTSLEQRFTEEIAWKRQAGKLRCKCSDLKSGDALPVSQASLARHKSTRNILDNCGRIKRKNVYDACHFPHLGNPNYVYRTYSKGLEDGLHRD